MFMFRLIILWQLLVQLSCCPATIAYSLSTPGVVGK